MCNWSFSLTYSFMFKKVTIPTKGQLISKQNCPAITSPKKQTQDFCPGSLLLQGQNKRVLFARRQTLFLYHNTIVKQYVLLPSFFISTILNFQQQCTITAKIVPNGRGLPTQFFKSFLHLVQIFGASQSFHKLRQVFDDLYYPPVFVIRGSLGPGAVFTHEEFQKLQVQNMGRTCSAHVLCLQFSW